MDQFAIFLCLLAGLLSQSEGDGWWRVWGSGKSW